MFLVLIAGRWIVSLGDLSRDEINSLLLGLVGHAPDSMALLGALNEEVKVGDKALKTYKLIIVLTVFSLSVVQFTIKTPDIERANTKKKAKQSKNIVNSKYFDLNCFKGKATPFPIDGTRLSSFCDEVRDKTKKLSAHATEAKEKAQANTKESGGRLSRIKSSVKNRTKAAKEKALKNRKVKTCAAYAGVLLHLFIALALHAGPAFAVRLVMTVRFSVFNEVHVFFLVKNAFEILVCIYRFVQTVRNSRSLDEEFSLDAAVHQVGEPAIMSEDGGEMHGITNESYQT